MTIPPDLNFLHPGFVIFAMGIAGILLLYVSLYLYRRRVLKQLNLPTENPRSQHLHRLRVVLLCLAWLFAVIALMGPQGNAYYPEETQIKVGTREVIFLIDVSDSMSVVDTRMGQSRLNHAKEVAQDLAMLLAGRDLSLYTFTSELTPQVPQTMDVLFTRLMIDRLEVNDGGVPGTDFLVTLEQLKETIGDKSLAVILLSDGGDTEWESLSGPQKQKRIDNIAQVFKDTNVKLITVGTGSKEPITISNLKYQGEPVTTELHPQFLEALGPYFEANEKTTTGLSKEIIHLLDREAKEAVTGWGTGIVYKQYFQVPLFLSLLCLLAALYCPETRKKIMDNLEG